MTLTEMRDRLTAIIEENEKRGWSERNSSRVVVEHKAGKRLTEYHPVKHVGSSWVGLYNGYGLGLREEKENYFEISIDEPVARYGGRG